MASCEVLSLTEDVHHGPAENLRDGLDALDGCGLIIGILEAVAEPLPHDIFERDGLFRLDHLLPGAVARADVRSMFDPAKNMVFRINNFRDQSTAARTGGVIGNGDREIAVRVSSGKLFGASAGDPRGRRWRQTGTQEGQSADREANDRNGSCTFSWQAALRGIAACLTGERAVSRNLQEKRKIIWRRAKAAYRQESSGGFESPNDGLWFWTGIPRPFTCNRRANREAEVTGRVPHVRLTASRGRLGEHGAPVQRRGLRCRRQCTWLIR